MASLDSTSSNPEPSTPFETEPIDLDLQPLPRWPALIALLVVGALYTALPEHLAFVPRYLVIIIVAGLSIPTVWAYQTGNHAVNAILAAIVTGTETLGLVGSVGLLVASLPSHEETPIELLKAASLLWVTNVLIFALWYWRLDAGGPHVRDMRPGHPSGAFLFPQMNIPPGDCNYDPNWTPDFVDYLFLAFNTSTALSPTDTAVLSRWAKGLMMLQASISLTVLAVLAARAVNVL